MLHPWRHQASCAGMPPDLFYPVSGDHAGETAAKEICRDCPALAECLDWAVTRPEAHGIWGATTPEQRRWLRAIYNTGDILDYRAALAAEITDIGRKLSGHEDERQPTPQQPCPRCPAPVPPGTWPLDRNTPGAKCGRVATYNRGCRCQACIDAKAKPVVDSNRGYTHNPHARIHTP